MSDETGLRKSLTACDVCNYALFDEVHRRKQEGESVNTICKDLEDFQRQLKGDVYYSANALRQRYMTMAGTKVNHPIKAVRSEQLLDDLAEMANDPDVQAKLVSATNIPPEKSGPVVESVPVVKTTSDFAEDARKLLTQANGIVTQRGHGFSELEKENLTKLLALIFKNLAGGE